MLVFVQMFKYNEGMTAVYHCGICGKSVDSQALVDITMLRFRQVLCAEHWAEEKKKTKSYRDYARENWVVRTTKGSPAIQTLVTEGDGVPELFEVRGMVKCLLCHGATVDLAVCEECLAAVQVLRAANNIQNLQRVLELANQPGFLTALEILTEESIGEYFMKRLYGDDRD